MKRKLICIIIAMVIMLCTTTGFADKSDGDLYTFCPAVSILFYNTMLKNFLELNDTQAAILQVSSDGFKEGNLVYSDLLQNTFFFFGGVYGRPLFCTLLRIKILCYARIPVSP